MRIAVETLAAAGAPAPVSGVVQQLVTGIVAAGRGDADYSALATVLFRMAGLDD
jgi:3-hydroxyisobutyrate dehydrogenase-like beta-hydroxyacid dehydrogenase